MGFIPHPPLYLSEIRTTDLWFLLAVGAIFEVTCRVVLLAVKRKPTSLAQKEVQLAVLQHETDLKRKLGPSAFVETSKLERQVLAIQKQVADLKAKRKAAAEGLEKNLLRYGNMMLSALIFVLYYGIPMVTLEPQLSLDNDNDEIIGSTESSSLSSPPLMSVLFPLYYAGWGVKLAGWGLPDRTNSVGALVVMWSAQTFCGGLMDAVDAYMLC